MVISLYPTQYLSIVLAEDPPKPSEPTFRGVNPSGESNNYIFDENQTVTILYKADRFDVDGLVLVGEGSGLDTDPITGRNFTLDSSLGPDSFYEIELNVTEYTYFFAYSWSNTLTNNTKEELDFVDNALGHQMWTAEGSQFPNFVDVVGGTPNDDTVDRNQVDEFYTAIGTEVLIVYEAVDSTNSTVVTLAFGNSTEALYNGSSEKETMVQVSDAGNVLRFEFNYTLTQRWVYFTASNEYGFERASTDEPIFHTLSNGFEFNTTFTEALNQFDDSKSIEFQYTDADTIVFNVTTVNATDNDEFSYRYRLYENDSSDEPLVDWIETSLTTPIVNKQEINKTIDSANFTQTVTIFNVVINADFEASNLLQVQAYVTYFGSVYNETAPRSILIRDARPDVTLLTANDTISRHSRGFIDWEYSTLRGSVISATIVSNTTDLSRSIVGLENLTLSFSNAGEDVTIEGIHLVTISVTNTFEIVNTTDPNQGRYSIENTREITAIYRLDTTSPIANFISPSNFTDGIGRVTIEFNFKDEGVNPTGVAFASLSWGNGLSGLTINVTSLEQINIKFRYNGEYIITLNVTDNAGNFKVITHEITATVQEVSTSERDQTPLSLITILASFALIGLISTRIKRKRL